MRVAVIGAGGIGGLYGGLLARAGHDVGFLARGPHLHAIQERGLEVQSAQFGTFSVPGRASDYPRDLGEGQADLVLFAVKTYDLESAAKAAAQVLAPDGLLVTFQNGVDAPDRVAELIGADHVLIGTTGLETTILQPGVIGHLSAVHYVLVAALHGPPDARVRRVVEVLREAEINASEAADGHQALWEKAFVLIPMATMTSVCQAPIGPIRELPETNALLDALLDEVQAVAQVCGHELAPSRQRVRGIIDTWAFDGKASMARDFERGRPTELDAITGALVRLADARGVEVPVARTTYALLRLREQLAARAQNPVGSAPAGR